MIPKVEWAALLEAADTVRTLPHARARPELGGGRGRSHRRPGSLARVGMPRGDLGLCPQLHLVEVPKEPIEGYEHDEKFLRKMHHVLLEVRTCPSPVSPANQANASSAQLCPAFPQVDVLEGTLQCPESGRLFPISRGIPNMLLSDEETET